MTQQPTARSSGIRGLLHHYLVTVFRVVESDSDSQSLVIHLHLEAAVGGKKQGQAFSTVCGALYFTDYMYTHAYC